MNLAIRSFQLLTICAPLAVAGGDNRPPPGSSQLSTQEIQCLFSDVRDDASVQDSAGTKAINYWYGDGSFTNQWSNDRGSGEVRGHWRAHNNRRCIVITEGLPERIGVESCAPMYRNDNRYFSVNSDGSVHGIHRLSPLSADQVKDC